MQAEEKVEEQKTEESAAPREMPEAPSEESRMEQYKKIYASAKKFIKLDHELINTAVEALRSFASAKKEGTKNLLGEEDDFIHVTITLGSVPLKFSPRPVQVPLKHPIYAPQYLTHVCLLVKDPQRKYKDLVQDLEVPCLAKIIGYEKLMKNYKQYYDRRQLVSEFDLFFCDKRIYRMLPKVTGSLFYRKKKFPFPLELKGDGQGISEQIEEALKSTYLMLGNGPHYSFRAARVSMKPKECLSNIVGAIYKALPHIIREEIKPNKIQCITLKTSSSPELPIYCHLSKIDVASYLEKGQEAKESDK